MIMNTIPPLFFFPNTQSPICTAYILRIKASKRGKKCAYIKAKCKAKLLALSYAREGEIPCSQVVS